MKFCVKIETTRIVSLENLIGLLDYRSMHGWETVDIQLPLNNDAREKFTFIYKRPDVYLNNLPLWKHRLVYPSEQIDINDEVECFSRASQLQYFLSDMFEKGWKIITSAKLPDIGIDGEDIRTDKIGFLMKKPTKRIY